MCVIVDANVAGLVFRGEPHSDFVPVFDWLRDPRRDGCLVFGGELAAELRRVKGGRSYLLQLSRAGRARQIPDADVRAEERRLARAGACRSNDPHVVALARVSGARTLCTHDGDLQRDFTNCDLISDPRGKVYKRPNHCHLLCHTRSCGLLRRRR
jgi:hypothetical protein